MGRRFTTSEFAYERLNGSFSTSAGAVEPISFCSDWPMEEIETGENKPRGGASRMRDDASLPPLARRPSGSVKIGATKTFKQWCEEAGYDPETQTYADPDPHEGAVPGAHCGVHRPRS